jgi:prevent-host-death family protein
MVNIPNDSRSLSDFKRKTSELLERLKKTGNPLILAINGKAEVVVQDAGAYQQLLARAQTIEGIQRGRSDVNAGRTTPARKVFDRLRRKHGISR